MRGRNVIESVPSHSCFVVPRRNTQTLCVVENGRLVDLHPVPIPINAECAVSDDGWIAWADPDDLNPIHLWHRAAKPERDKFASVRLPRDQCVKHLAFQGDVLWIVTERTGYVAVCQLGSPGRAPIVIAVPVTEPISHLAFRGSKLYATSDDGDHKRLHCLSANPHGPVTLEASIDLPRRNMDDFVALAVGESWVAVLEWTFSFCEESCYLRLFHPETLAILPGSERTSVTTNSLFVYPDAGRPIAGAADWKSLAWAGDVLLLASGPQGVGYLDLRGRSPQTGLTHEIRYVETPGIVERVIPCTPYGMTLAVMATSDGFDTIAHEFPAWLRAEETPTELPPSAARLGRAGRSE